jgi:hypothetical protein
MRNEHAVYRKCPKCEIHYKGCNVQMISVSGRNKNPRGTAWNVALIHCLYCKKGESPLFCQRAIQYSKFEEIALFSTMNGMINMD